MDKEVRAAVLVGPQQVVMETLPCPEPAPGEILVKVQMAGLDGTDVKRYLGDAPPGFYREDQLGKTIPSDEIVGIVEAVGTALPGQELPAVGDRVVMDPKIACGYCWACSAGQTVFCTASDGFGLMPVTRGAGLWGGCAEYVVVPPGGRAHRIPHDLDDRRALVCAVVLPDAVRWIDEKAQMRIGESVAVVGVGPQGLSTIAAARFSGAGRIVAVGTPADASRLELAKKLGADEVVISRPGELAAAVAETLAGGAIDIVVECSGHRDGVRLAWDVVGKLGRIVQIGLVNEVDVTVPITKMVRDEFTVMGGRAPRAWAYRAAITMATRMDAPLEEIASHSFPLEETEKALRTSGRLDNPEEIVTKVVVKVG